MATRHLLPGLNMHLIGVHHDSIQIKNERADGGMLEFQPSLSGVKEWGYSSPMVVSAIC